MFGLSILAMPVIGSFVGCILGGLVQVVLYIKAVSLLQSVVCVGGAV